MLPEFLDVPHFALPYHEFGLDVMALVGQLRHAEHRSIPEIHHELTHRGVVVAQRTVTNLLDRYDELRALATADPPGEAFGPATRPLNHSATRPLLTCNDVTPRMPPPFLLYYYFKILS